jgi:hypothetical protein
MGYITVQVDIERGKVIPREPEKLPDKASGVLTFFSPEPEMNRRRVVLPLIRGNGKRLIDPTREELDASLWD